MTEHQRLLSDSALTVFRLNGQFLALAESLAQPVGLTATRWQVLGAVIDTPLTVSDIARSMGITRQSVQRTADLLVADGLLTYRDNPAHRRAKLVAITDDGRAANDAIGPAHRIVADRLASILGDQRWQQALDALHDLSAALDAHPVA
ncbi:regulatory protein MarR [Gordonia bronchialis DSM 43247]|uniref:Regulatory protein MarR n=1 Tax=Gordonia bronchialis (strain ATCC 25592 / DSM 43247 / BCRC 13721 / JCM 3198 / KCTC 3076 / NBRC 16047 / NCTC 10667) TaxID=526226 RepID=D0L4L4_GORB4|nr:MarR family transcriptional regulator [Gordonia bronchialis]ACY23239.1 regulatory protein MarR [Gordonia bronchialis DSM 43247]MCC3321409.1 MarR family transcriptional regulator [Gordonia bronchialis]QGS23365.1 MarR family transcriptional regulator [Gordonia bronchialis]UAK36273.1 MarR family transcriptional regulator [Gordonia bronchialis]STQ66206.1 transcriptional regulator SlyA [Gordonia bronchialis]